MKITYTLEIIVGTYGIDNCNRHDTANSLLTFRTNIEGRVLSTDMLCSVNVRNEPMFYEVRGLNSELLENGAVMSGKFAILRSTSSDCDSVFMFPKKWPLGTRIKITQNIDIDEDVSHVNWAFETWKNLCGMNT